MIRRSALRLSNRIATTTDSCGVHRITLNRPEVRNAFDAEMIGELTQVFRAVPDDSRVVVLTGEGKAFSAGADLNWMKAMAQYTESENREDALKLYGMVKSLWDVPVPVVGRINGDALGGGAGLVSACDIAVGASHLKMGFTEVRLGLIPAAISPFVTAKITNSAAHRYFMTGERFTADECLRMGLLTEVGETIEEVDAAVQRIVEGILASSPAAVRASKQLLRVVSGQDLDVHQRYVCDAIAAIRVSEEGQEGLKSFLEKRKPRWMQ